MIPRFLDVLDLDFFLVAMRYTLLEQETLEVELPYCERRNVGVVIGGVYNSGITATGPVQGAKYNYKDATPEIMGRVGQIERVCRAHGVPLAAAALQFPLDTRPWPPSFPERSIRTRCARTRRISVTRSLLRSGRT